MKSQRCQESFRRFDFEQLPPLILILHGIPLLRILKSKEVCRYYFTHCASSPTRQRRATGGGRNVCDSSRWLLHRIPLERLLHLLGSNILPTDTVLTRLRHGLQLAGFTLLLGQRPTLRCSGSTRDDAALTRLRRGLQLAVLLNSHLGARLQRISAARVTQRLKARGRTQMATAQLTVQPTPFALLLGPPYY